MCLAVAENGVGFGEITPDCWLFADGIYYLELELDGYWMLCHVNGSILYFPNGLVSDDDIRYLRSKKMRAGT